ncbi:phage repressor protein, partial [Erwinia amylovora]|nr:phage repressor protein [Erwinia amylovora]
MACHLYSGACLLWLSTGEGQRYCCAGSDSAVTVRRLGVAGGGARW